MKTTTDSHLYDFISPNMCQSPFKNSRTHVIEFTRFTPKCPSVVRKLFFGWIFPCTFIMQDKLPTNDQMSGLQQMMSTLLGLIARDLLLRLATDDLKWSQHCCHWDLMLSNWGDFLSHNCGSPPQWSNTQSRLICNTPAPKPTTRGTTSIDAHTEVGSFQHRNLQLNRGWLLDSLAE